jgi:hypothetical protein
VEERTAMAETEAVADPIFCSEPDGLHRSYIQTQVGAAHRHAGKARHHPLVVPPRQVIVAQACLGRLSAGASTLTRGGLGSSLRTGRT